MTIGEAFGILGISPTDSQKDIQHAFALRSRNAHPEENPEGWSELSQAYQLCMDWAKNKSKPEPTLDEATGFSNSRPESAKTFNTDYFDVFRQLDRKQEERKEIEQQLSELLEQLEAEKTIKSLGGYRRALEQLSRLPAFDSDDPRKSIFGQYHQTSEPKPKSALNKHGIINCDSLFRHCFDFAHPKTCCHSDGKLISVPTTRFHTEFMLRFAHRSRRKRRFSSSGEKCFACSRIFQRP